MDKELINKLNLLEINPDSLSNKEKKVITEINDIFEKHVRISQELKDAAKENKFNKSTVASKVSCTRQTLYNNPTLLKFLDYCLKEDAKNTTNNSVAGYVSKDKYDALKEENNNLLSNIVDDALKDEEIDSLIKATEDKDKRIIYFIERNNKLNDEIKRLKKIIYEMQHPN